MEQKVQKCVDGYFAEDVRQHDLVRNNVLSYLLESVQQPSGFRPVPCLASKPGVGKTAQLPPSVAFLAAGNFPPQKELLQSRLEFMEYTPHFGKWAAHMLRPDLSRDDYLARFATVDFLCANPHLFNPSESEGHGKPAPSTLPEKARDIWNVHMHGRQEVENPTERPLVLSRLMPAPDKLESSRESQMKDEVRTHLLEPPSGEGRIDRCLQEGKIPVVFLNEQNSSALEWEAAVSRLFESEIGDDWKINGSIRFIAAGNSPEGSGGGRHYVRTHQNDSLSLSSGTSVTSPPPGHHPHHRLSGGGIS